MNMYVLYRTPPLEGSANYHVTQAIGYLTVPLTVKILTYFHPTGKISLLPKSPASLPSSPGSPWDPTKGL